MGNASKAQVTKQLDFTIPVDYVGGGGNYILIYFFIVLKSGDRSAFLLAPLYIYLEQTLKHGSTCSFLLASKLIFQFQVGERVRGRIAACGGELLWSSERGRSGAGRASQQ